MTSEEDKALARTQFGGSWVGGIAYWIFKLRKPLLWLFVLITLALGFSATRLEVQAGFTKMIPLQHEYMRTFVDYQKAFGGANKILVALRSKDGDIYSGEYLDKLKQLHDDLFYLHGVNRASVLSLYSPNAIFIEVVEDGFKSGPVLPNNFDGTPASVAGFRENLLKSNWVGRIVASDFKSALVAAVLQDTDPDTGKRLDVKQVGADLEKIRAKYENDKYSVHIVGFAKSAADIAAGAQGVLLFFAAAFLITALLLYWYSCSLKLTFWALIVAMVPVVWLLGLLPLLGLALDPMSILVPFLIFSIGVSHAVQMTNAWKLDVLNGADGVTAARSSFMKLFIPGASALVANAVGFMVIAFVKIEMVQELAITATLGVSLMIFTNKLLLPILLSFMQLSARDAKKIKGKESSGNWLWSRISAVATRRYGAVMVVGALVLLGVGVWKAKQLHIGDLGQGVPELREHARYNQDVDVVSKSFAVGVDVLNVIAEAKTPGACVDLDTLEMLDRFEFFMRQTDGVQSVRGMAGFVRGATAGYSEGDLKWAVIPDTKQQRAQAAALSTRGGVSDLANRECSAMNVSLFTRDHQAPTIAHIVDEVKTFKGALDSDKLTFRLASGNVGVMAATNEAVEAADKWVNLALFASVGLLCLVTFRSVMATLCIILPLGLSVVLCNALMAMLGVGLKVNTLPVVALGVGVGVDYGIYLFEVMRHEMKERNLSLREGFLEALKQRGTASLFTAVTMTIGVATWVFSALKFQADMGVLLGFMFLVNLLGAILLLPALAAYLYAGADNRINAGGRAKKAGKAAKTAAATVLLAMLAGATLLPSDAGAAMTAADVERLGKDLTPVGAVRGPNTDGTIPAWTGGLTTPPAGWKPDAGFVDPFAADELLFTISAANVTQYVDHLPPGMVALLKAHPNSVRMNVYPTRRTAAYPKPVTDLAARYAATAVLEGGAIKNFGDSTVPFPIPRNGDEAIWNHLVRYQGGAVDLQYDRTVVLPGEEVSRAKIGLRAIWDTNLEPRPRERESMGTLRLIEPAIYAGVVRVTVEPIGFVNAERESYLFNVSQKRLRKEAHADYDAEAIAVGGLRVIDQFSAFNGAPDRFDWKLLGKKELYIPYNSYRLGDKALKASQVLGKFSVNPDLVRYELHRVWIVEGTVKAGFRHVYPKRTFYLDEDSWAIVYEDAYDTRGNLWRVAMHPLMQLYDVPMPFYRANIYHDLTNGGYLVEGLDNEGKTPWRFGFKGKLADWTPEAIMETASKR